MTRYRYVLKADQYTSGYGGKWLNIDTPVTVTASDFEEASKKATALMSAPRNDTNGWKFFVSSVEELAPEPEVIPAPQLPEIALRTKFRLKGIR